MKLRILLSILACAGIAQAMNKRDAANDAPAKNKKICIDLTDQSAHSSINLLAAAQKAELRALQVNQPAIADYKVGKPIRVYGSASIINNGMLPYKNGFIAKTRKSVLIFDSLNSKPREIIPDLKEIGELSLCGDNLAIAYCGTIHIYDLITNQLLRTFKTDIIRDIALFENVLVTAISPYKENDYIDIYELGSGDKKSTIELNNPDAFCNMQKLSTHIFALTTYIDNKSQLHLIDVRTGKSFRNLELDDKRFYILSIHGSKILLNCTDSKKVLIYDTAKDTLETQISSGLIYHGQALNDQWLVAQDYSTNTHNPRCQLYFNDIANDYVSKHNISELEWINQIHYHPKLNGLLVGAKFLTQIYFIPLIAQNKQMTSEMEQQS